LSSSITSRAALNGLIQQFKGHAKGKKDGIYETTGSVSKDERMLEKSESLGSYGTFEEALHVGIVWAKAWVDTQS
jgi:hypothetical protein